MVLIKGPLSVKDTRLLLSLGSFEVTHTCVALVNQPLNQGIKNIYFKIVQFKAYPEMTGKCII